MKCSFLVLSMVAAAACGAPQSQTQEMRHVQQIVRITEGEHAGRLQVTCIHGAVQIVDDEAVESGDVCRDFFDYEADFETLGAFEHGLRAAPNAFLLTETQAVLHLADGSFWRRNLASGEVSLLKAEGSSAIVLDPQGGLLLLDEKSMEVRLWKQGSPASETPGFLMDLGKATSMGGAGPGKFYVNGTYAGFYLDRAGKDAHVIFSLQKGSVVIVEVADGHHAGASGSLFEARLATDALKVVAVDPRFNGGRFERFGALEVVDTRKPGRMVDGNVTSLMRLKTPL